MTRVTLLGPQRLQPILAPTLESLGATGPIATVTAGWQEREPEDRELDEHLGGRTVNLRLFQRMEESMESDPEFAAAHRRRVEKLREMQDLYLIRLDHAIRGTYEVMRRGAEDELTSVEVDDAVADIRALDARHLERVAEVHEEFYRKWPPHERQIVRRHREELAGIVSDVSAVAIAGGHVAVILNCMHLFNVPPMIRDTPVVAWSAGAMATGERIVLFHDMAPQGPGHAEVLDSGVGLHTGVIPLPHARHRLRLDDRERITLMAKRFEPARCVAMDEGARLDFDGSEWQVQEPGPLLTASGTVEPMALKAAS